MTRPESPSVQVAVSRQVLPLLLLLFVGSGCAALIYEIVWFQLLSLIVGSSAISMGVLLATFMGGMCLGSLALARYISPRRHPLRVYALIELGIGVFGLLVLFGLPWVGGLYTAIGGPGFTGLLFRGLFCALFLLGPTLLMGATLPAVARWVEGTPQGVSWLGFLYGANTVGAVGGCLLAGFYLLRVHDMQTATYVAVLINVIVAAGGYGLSRVLPHHPPAESAQPVIARVPAGSWPVLVTIGLSGLTALGAEVVWTRLLSLTLGATTYTFSLILAAFLVGIGLGSWAGSMIARTSTNARVALGLCQLLLMLGIAWAAYSISEALPYWPINPSLSPAPRFTFEIDMVRCLWVVLPSAILWGASFPLALAGIATREQDTGRMVGVVYAANTVGAIIGALVSSLLLIAWIGTQQSQRLLIVIAGLSALLLLVPAVAASGRLILRSQSVAWLVVTIVLGGWLVADVHAIPPLLVAYGRYMVTWLDNHGDIIYWGEGMNSSMAVSRLSNGVLNYHNAGKVQASSEPQDMRLQRMLGHLTTLVPEHARSVLVIGCGAGVTAGAVSIDPVVETETIAEIEPLVPFVVSKYFSEHNFSVVSNPKVHVKINDARHFLLTSHQKFDAVTSDPFDPWVKGAATLYTKEFFEVVKQHLNPGGIMTVFVQLYESNTEAVKSEVATFFAAFPNGVVFGNTNNGSGYDVVLMGQVEPRQINIDAMEEKLASPQYAQVAESLRQIGFYSAKDLFATYAAQGPDLKEWLADAQINRDRNLRLQYLAGLGLNLYEQDQIYRGMLQYRKFPENLFTGSPERLSALRAAILWGQ